MWNSAALCYIVNAEVNVPPKFDNAAHFFLIPESKNVCNINSVSP